MLLIFLGWYRAPLAGMSGVEHVLMVLIAADVILGPLLTFIVFDRNKPRLWADIGCIVALQITAMVYGLHAIEAGRPHYLVFVKDRFEAVSKADLRPEDLAAAASNRAADSLWFTPRALAAEMPSSNEDRNQLLFESVTGGRDVQHFPRQYRPYDSQSSVAAAKGIRLEVLRKLNPGKDANLQTAIEQSGLAEERLRYLPIKGRNGDGAMLVDSVSGAIIGMMDMVPWTE